MGRDAGWGRMVHDYKERETMKESGKYWDVKADTEWIRVEADLTDEKIGFITLAQSETDPATIAFEPEDVEPLVKAIREAATLVKKRYPEATKNLTAKPE